MVRGITQVKYCGKADIRRACLRRAGWKKWLGQIGDAKLAEVVAMVSEKSDAQPEDSGHEPKGPCEPPTAIFLSTSPCVSFKYKFDANATKKIKGNGDRVVCFFYRNSVCTR